MSTPSPDLVAAGRALARGEPLETLALVGRTDDALALTLRGVAYAQMGDFDLARSSLSRASSIANDPRTAARARAALVEIALRTGDPAPVVHAAQASADELARLGDARNATLLRLVVARAAVLVGRLDEARRIVDGTLAAPLPLELRAVALLARAEIAVRAVAATDARGALTEARRALSVAPNPILLREADGLERELARPIARVVREGVVAEADLFAVERVLRGAPLLVDGCHRDVVVHPTTVALARRPTLFRLALVLAHAWPAGVPRDELARRVFETRRINPSHRSRMRVEIGRLRTALRAVGAEPVATSEGYRLVSARDVVLLLPLTDDDGARVALLLRDGASWSARGLAEHVGISIRTAQRTLASLVESGAATRTGTGRDVRYTHAGTPIGSRMLLLGLVPRA